MAESYLERNSTLFQIVSAAVFMVIGAAANRYFGYRSRTTKTLDYRILSDRVIVSRRNRPNRLKIMVGDFEVNNPCVTLLQFENTGNQVIEPSDFLDPIEICRKNAKVIDWSVVDQSERNIAGDVALVKSPAADHDEVDEHLTVQPNTLNPGDTFDVQITYDVELTNDGRLKCQPGVTTRIKGQTRTMWEVLNPDVYGTRPRVTPLVVLTAIAAFAACIAALVTGDPRFWVLSLAATMPLLAGAVTVMAGRPKHRRPQRAAASRAARLGPGAAS